jgi:hypothetical protein
MKLRPILIGIILVFSFLLSAVAPFATKRVSLTVINKTWGKAAIQLKSGNTTYKFKARLGTTVYPVRPLDYKATFSGCFRQQVTRNLSLRKPVRITLVCNPNVPLGEPGMIKIVIYKPPEIDRR